MGRAWARGMRLALAAAVLAAAASLATPYARASFGAFIVSGDSMEPGIHAGDLVLVRGQPDYAVGAVVAYQHRDLGAVLHRIVRIEGDTFVLQGDNRDAPDAYPVAASAVRGALLVRVPRVGRVAGALGPAGGAALLGTLALLGSLYSAWRSRARSGLRGRSARLAPAMFLRGEYFAITSRGARLAGLLSAVAVTALAVIAVIQVAGTTQTEVTREPYEHRGEFSYAAAGAPGVYDTSTARTGDPVFRRLANRADVGFRYEFRSLLPSNVRGTYRIDARISQGTGWNRTLSLVPPAAFKGPNFDATAVLDLAVVQGVIEALERQTGVESRAYLIALVPEVYVTGVVDGRPINERFAPEQRFLLDAQVVQPQPPAGSNELSFMRVQHGSVAVTHQSTRALSAGGVRVTAAQLRVAALVALATSVPALLGWIVVSALARRRDETATIEAEYDEILVHTRLDRLPAGSALVAVASMDDLVRIAELERLPVLDEQPDGVDHAACYFVVSPGGATYYYRPRDGSQPHPAFEERAA